MQPTLQLTAASRCTSVSGFVASAHYTAYLSRPGCLAQGQTEQKAASSCGKQRTVFRTKTHKRKHPNVARWLLQYECNFCSSR
eukprot:322849-Amphidinium_carterae.1